MHSLLLKLFILCLASRQLEATGGEGGSSHHGVQSQNSPAENKEQSRHHHGGQHQEDSPGTMTFTVVSKRLEKPEFKGAIIDFGVLEPGKCRGELLENDPDGNPRFSVDWAKCGVKKIIDLLKIRIHPKFEDSGYHLEQIVQLNVPFPDLGQYFKGGEAIIELHVNGSPIVYLKGSARPNPAANRSKNSHLATFIVKHEDEAFLFHHVYLIEIWLTQTLEHKTCESENLPDKSGFTVDWAKCGLTKASDLAHAEMRLKFGIAGMFVERHVDFTDVDSDVLKHSFKGGKVQISFPFNGMEKPILSAIKDNDSDAPESSGHHGHGLESPKPHNENPKAHLNHTFY